MTVQFQPGQTYYDRSACDHECIFSMHVVGRTAKTIRATIHGKAKSLRINVWDGVEQVKPFGSYSMCSIMRADKTSA